MAQLYNLARMHTSTVGTGPLTLTSAVSSFLTFAQAGAEDGDYIRYAVEDGHNREIGGGTYTNGGATATLTRDVLKSTNNDNPISLVAGAQVSITAAAEDLGYGGIDGGEY